MLPALILLLRGGLADGLTAAVAHRLSISLDRMRHLGDETWIHLKITTSLDGEVLVVQEAFRQPFS